MFANPPARALEEARRRRLTRRADLAHEEVHAAAFEDGALEHGGRRLAQVRAELFEQLRWARMTKAILQRVGGECAVELRPAEDSTQGFEQGGRTQVDEQTQILEAREGAGRRRDRFVAGAERRERAKQRLRGNLQVER